MKHHADERENGKLLTVSVAAYHVEKYLPECLDSFVLPEYAGELEVLVINDGSGEEINNVFSVYGERYPRIFRLIDKENGGHGSTVNTGIREAQGKFFKCVDGDDCVYQDGLRQLLDYLKHTRADMIVTDYETFDDTTGNIRGLFRAAFPGRKAGESYDFDEVSGDIFVNMHAVTFRTEILKNMGRFLDEHCFYVDAQYRLYPIPFIGKAAFLDARLYRYRLGRENQSMAIRSMQRNCGQHERVLERLLQFYSEEKEMLSPAKKAYIQKGIARFAVSQVKIYLSYPPSGEHKRQIITLDSRLRQAETELYHKMKNPAVWLLRKSGYILYPFLSRLCRGKYHCDK